MNVNRAAIFFLVAVCLPIWGEAWGLDGPEVIARMQKRFGNLRSLSARFEKRHYWKLVDQTQKMKGQLYVQRPDRFRFETDVQTVVTDGETAWNYAPGNEQVVVSRYETVKDDRSYEKLLFDLVLLGGYSDRYLPRYIREERVGGKTCYLVELTARQEDTYISQIRLWVDRKLWLVRRVEYRNINDDMTTYVLSDLKVDRKVKTGWFRFKPPEGVEVVDLR